jgi:hypothetical protein
MEGWVCVVERMGDRVCDGKNIAYQSSVPGYASTVILRNKVQSLVLGAPRYQHTGLVVMFRRNFDTWEANANIKGSQVSTECKEQECAEKFRCHGWHSRLNLESQDQLCL